MHTYLALLRGVNVGGKSLLSMGELIKTLTANGLSNVHTYIQSGNVIFSADTTDTNELAARIKAVIEREHGIVAEVVVHSKADWARMIQSAPGWWGKDKEWKHNLLVLIKPYTSADIVAVLGELKPDIEKIEPGDGVLYQSLSIKLFGRTTMSKFISSPLYKKMTIRNYNTATKLLALLETEEA